jgi:cellulose synthase/poly-beta-1,6-N-acetylglucosamine synthase-like glycosyltransferase
MNGGARASSGDVLVFLHADVRLGRYGLAPVRDSLRDPDVVGGNFDIRYEGSDWATAIFTRINRWRRRLGVFYGDSGIFCRRKVFEALGGYSPWPILEDYDFARRLRKAGKLALLDEPIWVSDRRWRISGLVPTLWSWFWVQGLYLAGVAPERLAGLYRPVRPINPVSGPCFASGTWRADVEEGCRKELTARAIDLSKEEFSNVSRGLANDPLCALKPKKYGHRMD